MRDVLQERRESAAGSQHYLQEFPEAREGSVTVQLFGLSCSDKFLVMCGIQTLHVWHTISALERRTFVRR